MFSYNLSLQLWKNLNFVDRQVFINYSESVDLA